MQFRKYDLLKQNRFLFTLAVLSGVASLSIYPISIFELSNYDSESDFKEIKGDILDPDHPFQQEQKSIFAKNQINQASKSVIISEEVFRYIGDIPEAGGPVIPNEDYHDEDPKDKTNLVDSKVTNPTSVTPDTNQNSLMFDALDTPYSTLQLGNTNHKQNLMSHCDNEPGPYVDLHGCYLRGVNFANLDLRYANLSETNLSNAILIRADLTGANLSGAYLTGADLRGVTFSYKEFFDHVSNPSSIGTFPKITNLRNADLSAANLQGADLSGVDMREANLQYANLQYTVYSPVSDLRGTNLQYASMENTWGMEYADLRGAQMSNE